MFLIGKLAFVIMFKMNIDAGNRSIKKKPIIFDENNNNNYNVN